MRHDYLQTTSKHTSGCKMITVEIAQRTVKACVRCVFPIGARENNEIYHVISNNLHKYTLENTTINRNNDRTVTITHALGKDNGSL